MSDVRQWIIERRNYLYIAGVSFTVGCAFTFATLEKDAHHAKIPLLLVLFLTEWVPSLGFMNATDVPVVHRHFSRGRLLVWICGASYSGMALGIIFASWVIPVMFYM